MYEYVRRVRCDACRQWPLKCASAALALTANAATPHRSLVDIFHWSFMKLSALLPAIALVAACTQSPTGPTTQSQLQSNHSVLVAPGTMSAARNPGGTGQPSASCGSDNAMTEPKGFSTAGFANAETRYAGSDGTPSLANGNSHAVSQYDVACYQLSNK